MHLPIKVVDKYGDDKSSSGFLLFNGLSFKRVHNVSNWDLTGTNNAAGITGGTQPTCFATEYLFAKALSYHTHYLPWSVVHVITNRAGRTACATLNASIGYTFKLRYLLLPVIFDSTNTFIINHINNLLHIPFF